MPQPRKPTVVLQLSGAFQQNPSRGRERISEPVPTGGIGNPPSYLADDEKKVWREVRKSAFWLTDADRITLESLCRMVSKMRKGGDLKASDYGVLRMTLGSLGLTPVD